MRGDYVEIPLLLARNVLSCPFAWGGSTYFLRITCMRIGNGVSNGFLRSVIILPYAEYENDLKSRGTLKMINVPLVHHPPFLSHLLLWF